MHVTHVEQLNQLQLEKKSEKVFRGPAVKSSSSRPGSRAGRSNDQRHLTSPDNPASEWSMKESFAHNSERANPQFDCRHSFIFQLLIINLIQNSDEC
ncbi:MAG: hypothetical protein C5B49_16315 [Bdellovibrio sp.]|nr:MAG: hypothetical protein C5B49_16315 [Bdellovibrio sp.]